VWHPFKKRRVMRDVYSEEKTLLSQVESLFMSEQDAEEQAILTERAQHIEALLKKIAPWKKLKLSAYAKRIGIALGIYLILMIPVGLYFLKNYYFNQTELVSNTEGVGTKIETQYVPVTTVDSSAIPVIYRNSRSQEKVLETNKGQGMDAGMAVAILEGTQTDTVVTLWTAPRDGKRVLLKQTEDAKLHPMEKPIVLINDLDIVAASAYRRSDGTFVVVNAIEQPKKQIILQVFSEDWKPRGVRIVLEADVPNEHVEGVQVSVWGTRTVILTTIIPPEGSSVLEQTKPMLRILENDFSLAYASPMYIAGIDTDLFANFFTRTESNRFYILSSGKPSIDESKGQRGSELYAFEFANNGAPIEYFRLTNNGRPKDFWPSGSFFDEETGETYITNHRIPAPNFSDKDYSPNFPVNTATNYVQALDKDLNMIGGTMLSETGSRNGKAFGFTHTRIYKVHTRLYALYDKIQKDEGDGSEDRILLTRYVDLNR